MRILKLYFQDASSAAAYEASIVTRDRALAAQQQSIDIIKRLISQMEDDPLMTLARESLEKILKNPEVITDEVFGNIMSKTQEVLNANYDSQVEQFLDTARSRGVTGDTLAIQLSKAKNARAQGMAAAYRDALIARAKEGLTTSIDAINTTFSNLNAFYQNKRVASEDLVNIYQSVVPEPFQNYGAPGAGGAGGGGGAGVMYSPIQADYSGAALSNAFQESFEKFNAPMTMEDFQRIVSMPGQVSGGPTSVTGTLTDAERLGLPAAGTAAQPTPTGGAPMGEAAAQAEEARLRVAAGLPAQPVSADVQEAQLRESMGLPAQPIPAEEQLKALQQKFQQTINGAQAPLALDPNLSQSMQDAASNIINQTLAKAPTSYYTPGVQSGAAAGLGAVTPGQTAGITPTSYGITNTGLIYPSSASKGQPAPEVTMTGGGLPAAGVTMGGGVQEAQRVAGMIGQTTPTGQIISPTQIIGTTSGGGVRSTFEKPTTPEAFAKAYNLDPNVVNRYWSNQYFTYDKQITDPVTGRTVLGFNPGSFTEGALAAMKKESQNKTASQQLANKITVSNPYGEGTVTGVRK